MIAIALGVLVLVGTGGSAVVFFMNKADSVAKQGKDSGPDSFVDVPPMVVNLRSADGQARYLKLRFIMVAADAGHMEQVRDRLPLVLDALQPFLRELRPEDLNGSAAVYRVKEEMMRRAAEVFGAGVVRDILIQDLVQQ